MHRFSYLTIGAGLVVLVLLVAIVGLFAFSSNDDDDRNLASADPMVQAAASVSSLPTATPPPTATPTPSPPQIFSDVFDSSGTTISHPGVGPNGLLPEIFLDEDGVKHLIPPELIEGGGVGRDGIPSIDSPHFVGPDRWAQMVYQDDWLVVGVDINGKQRAYPLRILVWHEVVNDTFEDQPLLVTF